MKNITKSVFLFPSFVDITEKDYGPFLWMGFKATSEEWKTELTLEPPSGLEPGTPGFKTLDNSQVNSAVHPSKVDKLSIRNSWELNGKK